MADISVTCKHCGHQTMVSEHADSAGMLCPSCNQPLSIEQVARGARLNLKKSQTRELLAPEMVEENKTLHPSVSGEVRTKPAGMDRVHISRDKVKTPKAMLAWFGFVMTGVLLLGLQYCIEKYPGLELKDYYLWARAAVAAICGITLLITAFEDSVFQGVFVLLFVPYAIYYVFVRSDSYLLRGSFLALLISVLAEQYFIGDEAFLLIAQEWVNDVIDAGSSAIDRAGDAPRY
ncbi:MAG: hypothetical protein JXB04_10190 [Kiritimatiellae bacterium]|nr:hypothetical protein [Kiritimatiellia bacterium]